MTLRTDFTLVPLNLSSRVPWGAPQCLTRIWLGGVRDSTAAQYTSRRRLSNMFRVRSPACPHILPAGT
jgi:hypothetical protein